MEVNFRVQPSPISAGDKTKRARNLGYEKFSTLIPHAAYGGVHRHRVRKWMNYYDLSTSICWSCCPSDYVTSSVRARPTSPTNHRWNSLRPFQILKDVPARLYVSQLRKTYYGLFATYFNINLNFTSDLVSILVRVNVHEYAIVESTTLADSFGWKIRLRIEPIQCRFVYSIVEKFQRRISRSRNRILDNVNNSAVRRFYTYSVFTT